MEIKFKSLQQIDKPQVIDINGEILKIGVIAGNVKSNIRVEIKSMLDEKILDSNIENDINVFYPKNVHQITDEMFINDNYYIAGKLAIIPHGLGDGEFISQIIIYYR
jgi:tellurite resistance-related uncharacterized protein